MKNRNPKIVEIVWNESKTEFKLKCRKCGQVWLPSLKPDGRFARGNWQCPNGCKPKK